MAHLVEIEHDRVAITREGVGSTVLENAIVRDAEGRIIAVGAEAVDIGREHGLPVVWPLRTTPLDLQALEGVLRYLREFSSPTRSWFTFRGSERFEVRWRGVEVPADRHDELVRVLWSAFGRSVELDGRPATLRRRRTLRELPPDLRRRALWLTGLVAFLCTFLLLHGGRAVVPRVLSLLVVATLSEGSRWWEWLRG